jgi:hypothetical protein
MKSRITITIDPKVHALARKTAKRRDTTVSGLIEGLLREEGGHARQGIVDKMTGVASLREPAKGDSGDDLIRKALRAKYIRG